MYDISVLPYLLQYFWVSVYGRKAIWMTGIQRSMLLNYPCITVAYFCPLCARYFSNEYVNMQDNYVLFLICKWWGEAQIFWRL